MPCFGTLITFWISINYVLSIIITWKFLFWVRKFIKCRMSAFVVLPLCLYLHWRRARYQKERARTHAAQFMHSKLPSTYIMNNINYRDQLAWSWMLYSSFSCSSRVWKKEKWLLYDIVCFWRCLFAALQNGLSETREMKWILLHVAQIARKCTRFSIVWDVMEKW